MPPVGFEPTISAGERPQTHALDRAATGTGNLWFIDHKKQGIMIILDVGQLSSVDMRNN